MRNCRNLTVATLMALALSACVDDDIVQTTPGAEATTTVAVSEDAVQTTPGAEATTVAVSEPASALEVTIEPTAVELTYAIADTGQTECYDAERAIPCPAEGEEFFGQDANHTGAEASYVDNGDGTVTDLTTGLMWQQDPGEKVTHAEAATRAESFDLAGYDDWRLPSIKELYSLVQFSGVDTNCMEAGCGATPFIDTEFFAFQYGDTDAGERIIDSQWATSTIYVGTTMGGDETMFGVNFADGRIKGYPIIHPEFGEKTYFAVYVRGNPEYGTNEFLANGDETVSDLATGLMWQQDDSIEGMDWSEALDYCTALDTGGYNDWRLPNAKELHSIVDYSRSPSTTNSAAIDPILTASVIVDEGGHSNYGFYWTGTTHVRVGNATAAAYIIFGEALAWMQSPQTGEYRLLDVHGAGAQRSDPKSGDAANHPYGRGPQGDVVRIDNLVRCVRSIHAA